MVHSLPFFPSWTTMKVAFARITVAILLIIELSFVSAVDDSLPRCFTAYKILTLHGGRQDDAFAPYIKASKVSRFKSLGMAYGELLKKHPIATKSMTSCFMFGLSDWIAQSLKSSSTGGSERLHWSRVQMASLVGLLYFGPAAHVWYNLMFQMFPASSVGSTLLKSALGQLIFGPCFMCVFFAASLAQQGSFSWIIYWHKICQDLPPVWTTGLGFWPFMSYISYTTVPKDWIPLFSNCCTLLFNIFLSFITYQ